MQSINLSPADWPNDESKRLLADQHLARTEAGYAEGHQGAVTVAYGGWAARAGLEALKQGGNAIDAAMTTAMAQIVLTSGAPVSFFGIQSLVYYEAKTGRVHCMNAEWNSVLGEREPMTIPGGYDVFSAEGLRGRGDPHGRTALVGGFLKGVEAAHRRFGALPFPALFEPSIHLAEHGVPITEPHAGYIELRSADLARLPATARILKKPDGSDYRAGDIFRQPALAQTLRTVAASGTDYLYRGPWAKKLIDAVRADGGHMTLEDLARYEVIWGDALIAQVGDHELHTSPLPNAGGVALVEALNLAHAAKLHRSPHWSTSGESLKKAVTIAQIIFLDFLPTEVRNAIYPGMDLCPASRLTRAHAEQLWTCMERGQLPFRFVDASPRHSDDVVVVDREGNIAAITHSSNTVMWGKTSINIDGISIPDPAAHQQAQLARIQPGERLPAPTETGILFKEGRPVLGFASMGSGLHHRSLQALLNVTAHGMSVREAVDAPDFFSSIIDPKTHALTLSVPAGRFPQEVLQATGWAFTELDSEHARFGGEGIWVAISHDPATGLLRAASHNRNNSAAFAY